MTPIAYPWTWGVTSLSVHDDFGTYEINFVFCSTTSVNAKYSFGTSLSRYRYIASCLFSAEGLQMLNGCLVYGRHQILITAGRSESESTTTKIEQTRHLWRPDLRIWGLLKGRCAPVPSQCTLIANVTTTATAKSPSKSVLEIKTPLWSAESTSVNIAPRGWSRRASAVVRRRRRLRAAATGDLTARGYLWLSGNEMR